MRYFLLFLLFIPQLFFAQDTLVGIKWYLNSAEIYDFHNNDSSTLVTSVHGRKYVRFTDKTMEFGSTLNSTESNLLYYYLPFNEGLDLAIYKTKKDLRNTKMQNIWKSTFIMMK